MEDLNDMFASPGENSIDENPNAMMYEAPALFSSVIQHNVLVRSQMI